MKKSGSIITIIAIVILAGVIVGVFGMPYIQQHKSSSSSSNVKVEKKESVKKVVQAHHMKKVFQVLLQIQLKGQVLLLREEIRKLLYHHLIKREIKKMLI